MVLHVEGAARWNAGPMAREDWTPMHDAPYPADRDTAASAQPPLSGWQAASGVTDQSNLSGALPTPDPKDPVTLGGDRSQLCEDPRMADPLFAGALEQAFEELQLDHSRSSGKTTADWLMLRAEELWDEAREKAGRRRSVRSERRYPGFIYFITSGPRQSGQDRLLDQAGRADEDTAASERTSRSTSTACMPGNRASRSGYTTTSAYGRLEGEWFRADTPGLPELISAANHFEGFPWDFRVTRHITTPGMPFEEAA
jgi:hypothetical protein